MTQRGGVRQADPSRNLFRSLTEITLGPVPGDNHQLGPGRFGVRPLHRLHGVLNAH